MSNSNISSNISYPNLKTMSHFLLFSFFFLVSFAAACDRCVHHSKAAYFSNAAVLESGACGYGDLAMTFNGGFLAAAVPSIFNDGAGCGACFQIRCKNTKVCTQSGTKVIVTDLNKNNQTDFVLSGRAFKAMAKQGMGGELYKQGITEIEYRRLPCAYNKNLGIRIEESSQKPHYLAIKLLYQGGQTEIVAVDVAQSGTGSWNYMSRNHGAVWDTKRVPAGGLDFRFVVTAGYDGKYYWAKNVVPANWKTGVVYDSGLKITDIAQEGCTPCDDGSNWRSSSLISSHNNMSNFTT